MSADFSSLIARVSGWSSSRPGAGRWTLVLRFIAVVVALHVPSWLLAWVFQSPRAEERPLFNLDLLLAAAIACFSLWAGAAVLLVAWAADSLRAAAKNYHFMSALDFLDAARFADMLNLRSFLALPLLAGLLGFVGCVWFVLQLTSSRQSRSRRQGLRLAVPLLGLAMLAAAGDIVNGTFHLLNLSKDSRLVNLNFAGSPAWNVWRVEMGAAGSGRPTRMLDPITFHALRDWQRAHPGASSMLVLVESMGLPRDPALRDWLSQRLTGLVLETRWDLQRRDEAFIGSTISGELRTLCGLQGHYARLDDTLAADCLPRQLAAQGVVSVGIHGFGLRMFDRRDWWPRVGLTPFHWPENAPARPMNCNQAFPGVCDSVVIEQAVAQAQTLGRFAYALTLDTHLPLDLRHAPPLPADLRVLCDAADTPAEACQLVRQLGDLLARLSVTLGDSATTPFVAVVGDHAPPFGEAANRGAFVEGRVPVFLLTPKVAH